MAVTQVVKTSIQAHRVDFKQQTMYFRHVTLMHLIISSHIAIISPFLSKFLTIFYKSIGFVAISIISDCKHAGSLES